MSRWNQEQLKKWLDVCTKAQAELDTIIAEMSPEQLTGVYQIIDWWERYYISQDADTPGAGHKKLGRFLLQIKK